jgi:hypothetical protein
MRDLLAAVLRAFTTGRTRGLAQTTVVSYSISNDQENHMKHAYRQFYQPKPNRTPEWIWRLWLWF